MQSPSFYQNEQELLQQMKHGNATAFTHLYNYYQPLLIREACHKFRNQEEAEDIVQEIFTSLWQRRQELSISISLKYYLFRAVHLQYAYKCRHNHVARKFVTYTCYTSREYTTSCQLESKELGQQIKTSIDSISAPACRKVFELLYIEDKSQKEIATTMHIKLQVVKNQTCRALKQLRTRLRFAM